MSVQFQDMLCSMYVSHKMYMCNDLNCIFITNLVEIICRQVDKPYQIFVYFVVFPFLVCEKYYYKVGGEV